jgi:hypothetical protein
VTVRGWDPEKKEEIEATRPMIPLSDNAAGIIEPPGPTLDLGEVLPLETVQSAYGAAAGTLQTLTALDVAAEAESAGSALLHAGAKVVIQKGGSPFDGKYVITAASHRFEHRSGWKTLLRLTREDRAVFLLPEVGDEVLVAFEHGDIHAPTSSALCGTARSPQARRPSADRLQVDVRVGESGNSGSGTTGTEFAIQNSVPVVPDPEFPWCPSPN